MEQKEAQFHIVEGTLFFKGVITKVEVPALMEGCNKLDYKKVHAIDMAEVQTIDSAGIAFLDELRSRIEKYYPSLQLINVSKEMEDTIEVFTSRHLAVAELPRIPGFFESIGASIYELKNILLQALILTSDISYWSFVDLFHSRGHRKGSFVQQSIMIGVDALPIVALLSLIIGFILALQSAAQLKQFGANIFLADLIGISIVREMGPLMTAIIVAGRSGSAIASEIATMKVTEEIDALRMMAINPIRYVVVPKFHAVTVCMPILVMFAIFVGVFGGLVVGVLYLDLTVVAFMKECISTLAAKDIIVSLCKSTVFAWVIVIIGCYYGFDVKGGAEGVGKATTLSVVASIFAVIVVDALFSLFYLG